MIIIMLYEMLNPIILMTKCSYNQKFDSILHAGINTFMVSVCYLNPWVKVYRCLNTGSSITMNYTNYSVIKFLFVSNSELKENKGQYQSSSVASTDEARCHSWCSPFTYTHRVKCVDALHAGSKPPMDYIKYLQQAKLQLLFSILIKSGHYNTNILLKLLTHEDEFI